MLSGCKRSLALVEGIHDYALLKGLLRDFIDVVLEPDRRRLYETLRRCSTGCLVVHPLGGIRSMSGRVVRLVLYHAKTLTGIDCFLIVVDSDEQEPRSRLERIQERLGDVVKLYKPGKIEEAGGGGLAYRCFAPQRARLPRLCLASWSCSAECWIASTLPGCSVSPLAGCDSNARRLCKACLADAKRRGAGVEDEARRVAETLAAGGLAAGLLQGLRRRLLDP